MGFFHKSLKQIFEFIKNNNAIKARDGIMEHVRAFRKELMLDTELKKLLGEYEEILRKLEQDIDRENEQGYSGISDIIDEEEVLQLEKLAAKIEATIKKMFGEEHMYLK